MTEGFAAVYGEGIQDTLMTQWNGLMHIPRCVLANWPVFFSFSVVHYIEDMVIQAIPNLGGTTGMVLNAGIRGARNVVDFAAWEKLRVNY